MRYSELSGELVSRLNSAQSLEYRIMYMLLYKINNFQLFKGVSSQSVFSKGKTCKIQQEMIQITLATLWQAEIPKKIY